MNVAPTVAAPKTQHNDSHGYCCNQPRLCPAILRKGISSCLETSLGDLSVPRAGAQRYRRTWSFVVICRILCRHPLIITHAANSKFPYVAKAFFIRQVSLANINRTTLFPLCPFLLLP